MTNDEILAKVLELHRENEERLAIMMQAITRLTNTVRIADIQIDDHEIRIAELEKGKRRQ